MRNIEDIPYHETMSPGDHVFRYRVRDSFTHSVFDGYQTALSKQCAEARVAYWNRMQPERYKYEMMEEA